MVRKKNGEEVDRAIRRVKKSCTQRNPWVHQCRRMQANATNDHHVAPMPAKYGAGFRAGFRKIAVLSAKRRPHGRLFARPTFPDADQLRVL
jgi:hypothetical protein